MAWQFRRARRNVAAMTDPRDKPSFASLLRRARGRQVEGAPSGGSAPDLPTPPSPLPPSGGRSFEAMQFLVDPARVRIWPGNARAYDRLTPDNCRDLIASIARDGMQKVAAIVRPVFDDAHYEYEVVAGTRRHFAVSYLRATTMPDLRYLVQVEILDDEAAFMLADLENRVRADVTEIERARGYALALDNYYDGHVGRMAQRLAIEREQLARMIRIADLPDAVVAAFSDPADLTLDPAFVLAQALDGEDRPRILATAQQIARAQAARRADREPPYSAREVLAQLLGVEEEALPPIGTDAARQAAAPSGDAPNAAELTGPNGQLVLSVPAVQTDRLTFHLHAGSGATREEMLDAVRTILDAAARAGFAID